jgi:bleomycin hydrolase
VRAIATENLASFESAFEDMKKNRALMHATVNNGIFPTCLVKGDEAAAVHEFSTQIEAGKVTNQKKSGRCWMFSALNVMRIEVMKKLNIENFELSQSYPLFYDKLEKSNYFLENIIETLEEPLSGRTVAFLLTDPLGDGGQWDMFANLVRKYGVVPKQCMGESKSSSETRTMDGLLTTKLRGFACELREAAKDGADEEKLYAMKGDMIATVYRMLSISLGKPPVSFTFETRDKDDKFIRIKDITPQQFYKEYVSMDLDRYISLINAPTADKPYDKMYTVRFLGNVVGGRPVRYLNLSVDALKQAALAQMRDGKVVWFGSDVGKCSDRDTGIMDVGIHDISGLFSTDFPLTKAQRLDYGDSRMTHAMVLTGVNLDENGKPDRWKVENSWGEEPGDKGYFVMSDSWFDQFVYQIVIDKKYLTADQQQMLALEPIVLEPWDPMGSLAL